MEVFPTQLFLPTYLRIEYVNKHAINILIYVHNNQMTDEVGIDRVLREIKL